MLKGLIVACVRRAFVCLITKIAFSLLIRFFSVLIASFSLYGRYLSKGSMVFDER